MTTQTTPAPTAHSHGWIWPPRTWKGRRDSIIECSAGNFWTWVQR